MEDRPTESSAMRLLVTAVRPARVEGDVREDLADLLARDAVTERPHNVERKLVGSVHRRQRRTVIRLRSRLESPGRSQTSP